MQEIPHHLHGQTRTIWPVDLTCVLLGPDAGQNILLECKETAHLLRPWREMKTENTSHGTHVPLIETS